jgi:hypothetical protein
MDPDEEIEVDFSPFLVMYKSGRVQRFGSTSRKRAGTDAATGVVSKDVLISLQARADPGKKMSRWPSV